MNLSTGFGEAQGSRAVRWRPAEERSSITARPQGPKQWYGTEISKPVWSILWGPPSTLLVLIHWGTSRRRLALRHTRAPPLQQRKLCFVATNQLLPNLGSRIPLVLLRPASTNMAMEPPSAGRRRTKSSAPEPMRTAWFESHHVGSAAIGNKKAPFGNAHTKAVGCANTASLTERLSDKMLRL